MVTPDALILWAKRVKDKFEGKVTPVAAKKMKDRVGYVLCLGWDLGNSKLCQRTIQTFQLDEKPAADLLQICSLWAWLHQRLQKEFGQEELTKLTKNFMAGPCPQFNAVHLALGSYMCIKAMVRTVEHLPHLKRGPVRQLLKSFAT